ncbi:uncharacterized protein DUF3592 [Flavobacterium sp. 270]|uniref:DUF3592 domain-containing protein n=1 Tax=Flavobacterium sp. 270 TaxID=2512114 RepID=UPI0010670A5A|nr:DUF3592 domain-containing protein [Flavobacterium sp. 270]TDW52535.1 uncharacterized protein DUF3592 [Flavobacterium sp. 270]
MELNKNHGIIIFIPFVFFMFYKPAVCFLILGTVALYFLLSSILFLNKIKKSGIESVGKIVSYESDNEGYKTPIIEFETADGQNLAGKPFLHTSTDLDKFQSYKERIDKNIKIIYDSENPEKFILKHNSVGCGMVLMGIVGLVFIFLSIGSLLGYFDIFN